MHFLSLFSADSLAGRVDISALPDQARMELLISGLEASIRQRIAECMGAYENACSWYFVQCDTQKNIIEIKSYEFSTAGHIDLHFVPDTVIKLALSNSHIGYLPGIQKLSGTIQTSHLPHLLEWLSLSYNEFYGVINMQSVPQHLKHCSFESNRLSGSVDLTKLPQGLQILNLAANKFSGSVVLTELPEAMEFLSVRHNMLRGELSFDHLPKRLKRLYVNENGFRGDFVFLERHPDLILRADGNAFKEKATVRASGHPQISLNDTAVEDVVDQNGERHMFAQAMMSGQWYVEWAEDEEADRC